MNELAKKGCMPCKAGALPLKGRELTVLREKLGPAWAVVNEHHLEREFRFESFKGALDFTNKVGELAESEGHHPEICLSWGKAKIILWTHKVSGLSENDFVMAAKIDELL